MKPKFKIKESFRWLAPEAFKVQAVGKKIARVRGIALKSNITSKNRRKYINEELLTRGATLTNCPVTINHAPYNKNHPLYDSRKVVGHVDWAQFEDGALEYLMTVKKQPYARWLREGNPNIKGVSVEADYLYNRCVKCGEKFYSEESFWEHMEKEHLIKDRSTITEPHGINFKALSLVVSPEVPGVEGTTTELWETLQHSTPLQLLEVVTNVKKQEETYMTKIQKVAVVTAEKRITALKPKITEQDEEIKPGSHYCEEHPDDPRCKEHKKAIHGEEQEGSPPAQANLPEGDSECPEGSHKDEVSGTCVPDEIPSEKVVEQLSTEQAKTELIKLQKQIDALSKKQYPDQEDTELRVELDILYAKKRKLENFIAGVVETEQGLVAPHVASPSTCPEGFEDDGTGGCKPIEWQEEPTAKTPAPLMVPPPTIEPAKTVAPELPAPAPAVGPVLEQEHGQAPQTATPTLPAEGPAQVTRTCTPGSHWDEIAGTCVPDLIPEQSAGLEGRVDAGADIVAETKLPRFLSLGEPFADYTDFADCVAKNKGKVDNPEAYCADIKRKVEGETVKETISKDFPLISEIERQGTIRDIKTSEAVNTNIKAIANLSKAASTTSKNVTQQGKDLVALGKLVEQTPKMINVAVLSASRLSAMDDKRGLRTTQRGLLTEATLRAQGDNENKQAIHNLSNTIVEVGKAGLGYQQKCTQTVLEAIQTRDAYYNKKLSQLATENKKIKENQVATTSQLSRKLSEHKRDFEKILAVADKNAEDTQKHVKSLEERIKEQEDELQKQECGEGEHYDKEQDKCVPNESPETTKEITKLKETVEGLTTKQENLEAKLTGNFKGHTKPITSDEGTGTSSKKLTKTMRTTAK